MSTGGEYARIAACRRAGEFWHGAALSVVASAAAAAALFASSYAALAQSAGPPATKYGWRQVYAGADALNDVWLLYTGVTLAPWSDDIHQSGLRLRAVTGYGGYRYDVGGTAPGPRVFHADTSFIDALVGYQHRFGELTAKAFIGVSAITHQITPFDGANRADGTDWGPKVQLEFWLNLGPTAWTSLDFGYTTAHDTASARWRAGWRALPTVSIGPEVRFDRNAGSARRISSDDGGTAGSPSDSGNHYSARTGAFIRYEWLGGEVSTAVGVASTVIGTKPQEISGYGTINISLGF
ncbi:MAG: cellulose biosynthesis protein BcsS [Hyphomicrobium sp.]